MQSSLDPTLKDLNCPNNKDILKIHLEGRRWKERKNQTRLQFQYFPSNLIFLVYLQPTNTNCSRAKTATLIEQATGHKYIYFTSICAHRTLRWLYFHTAEWHNPKAIQGMGVGERTQSSSLKKRKRKIVLLTP